MKRLFRLLFVLLSLAGLSASAMAQDLTPEMANQLKERTFSIAAKLQQTKVGMASLNASVLSPQENKLLNEILPKVERLLLDAGDLFGKAAENLPGEFGQDCLRQGCKKLREALDFVKDGKRLVRRNAELTVYSDLLEEIKDDIKDAIQDVGCRKRIFGGGSPWHGKKFRSEYSTPNGQWVKGSTELNGDNGSYQTSSGQSGSFYSVTYRDNGSIAEGYWRFSNGGTGWFSFTLNADGRSFHGNWGDGTSIGQLQKGSWKGQL
ncbi:MAG TPA: hypothetical protein VFO10_01315 [Oligoflexus sp.]|uniref:hypothetical protein n=1 Tax=Oligoflexus sp. TaxID=1971216 RepID=UPI002D7E613B|nr:hypothetical protein [Oligoflexus sp.]HET9235856.1 hypothetical protein [Oligoflexus sp.]